ncbi:protein kinase domain-containing protein [Leptolyngbya sp. NIES-2104]|uniref:protein kinase domain-containing protein n=1 Tax=Leptolyngbya sp. NIES-2104 TaxID=1552121 RepID=UPI00178CA7B5|nr:FHA domain-containing protein [Leptolyngbya sp. NIES-2104]
MITLTLLHPVQLTPVQHWTFDESTIVRVGRSTDNQVVLYSAVVSRYHAELRRVNSSWELVSLGANGTYFEGKRISQLPVRDGMIFRLARSGPNLQIHLDRSDTLNMKRTLESVRVPALNLPFNDAEEDKKTQPLLKMQTIVTDSKTTMDTSAGRPSEEWIRKQDDSVIGNYYSIELLSQGKVGMTYLGQRSGETVLLKTLNPTWINHPQALSLFERQAKMLKQLNHPGLPRWRDFFRIDGQPFLVTEMIEGKTLDQHILDHGKVDLKQAIAWMIEVCEILDYLHTQSPPVLHQDIRPQNLIHRAHSTSSYELALVDFGSVRGLDLDETAAAYLAPEQKNGQATYLSDLYAIGTTLAFLISAQQPRLFYRQWRQDYRFSPDLIPGLLPELIEVLYQLTEPNPSDRYQSAREVATALRSLI